MCLVFTDVALIHFQNQILGEILSQQLFLNGLLDSWNSITGTISIITFPQLSANDILCPSAYFL